MEAQGPLAPLEQPLLSVFVMAQQDHRRATEKTPSDVYEPIVREGEEKLDRSTLDLALSGLIAGLDISFGALAMAVVTGRLHAWLHLSPKAALFFGAFFYPVGFLFVILGRSELFTENTLTPVAGLVRGEGNLLDLGRYWAVVFATNIAGAIIFSLIASHVDVVFTPYQPVYRAMGTELVSHPFLQVLLGGVLAGWLVAIIAWLLQATDGDAAHFLAIYIPAYLIVGLGLFHCIIGTTEVLMGMFGGAPITWADWLLKFLLPTTLGNIIGGVTFVTGLKGFQAASNQSG